MPPKVSVLMPVYNGATYLPEAIESVLNQTFNDFEFLIIDDGSSDGSQEIVSRYRDERIRFFQNPSNLGQTRTLNKGLELAKGDYVARQDQDDISLLNRFKVQVEFLNNNPDVGVVSSATIFINATGKTRFMLNIPSTDVEIRWRLLTRNVFAHPAIMLRRDSLVKVGYYYDPRFYYAQDYDLWTRLIKETRGANISLPLVKYRVHSNNTGRQHLNAMLIEHYQIAQHAIAQTLPHINFSLERIEKLIKVVAYRPKFYPQVQEERIEYAQIYLDMFEAFAKLNPTIWQHEYTLANTALDALYAALYPPLPLNWQLVVKRVLFLFPSIFWPILSSTPHIVYRQWRLQEMR
jgi:glycosyltransferase involved in cell wall biosynthesis